MQRATGAAKFTLQSVIGGVLQQWGPSLVGGAVSGLGSYVNGAPWPVVLFATLIGFGVMAGVLGAVLQRQRPAPTDTWSAYDFYRDARNEAIALRTRDVLNWDKGMDLTVDHGMLLGRILATLRAKGRDKEADRIYPYGKPRHVPHYTDDAHTKSGDFLYQHRMMLTELEGRLTELRDEHAKPSAS